MPLTEDEFRALLVERSDTGTPGPADLDRLTGVRRRVARRQHRMRAAAVAAVVAVVAVGAGVPMLPGGRHRTPVAHGAKQLLPTYAQGGKLLADATLHSPRHGSVTVTFVPTDWRLTLSVSSTSPALPDGKVHAYVSVNGHFVTDSDLASGSGGVTSLGASPLRARAWWSDLGVRLGRPSTLTVTMAAQLPSMQGSPTPPPVPAADRPPATVTAGIYQRVPLAEYPLPSPPAALVPFGSWHGTARQAELDSRVVGATGRWELPVRVGSRVLLDVDAVAPGEVRVSVDGHLIADDESWDYGEAGFGYNLGPGDLRPFGVHVREGQRVTLTVEARRFTVPGWRLSVHR